MDDGSAQGAASAFLAETAMAVNFGRSEQESSVQERGGTGHGGIAAEDAEARQPSVIAYGRIGRRQRCDPVPTRVLRAALRRLPATMSFWTPDHMLFRCPSHAVAFRRIDVERSTSNHISMQISWLICGSSRESNSSI